MSSRRISYFALLTLSFLSVTYFGVYFLAADYVDVGDNNPMYLLRYRIGRFSLQHAAAHSSQREGLMKPCFDAGARF